MQSITATESPLTTAQTEFTYVYPTVYRRGVAYDLSNINTFAKWLGSAHPDMMETVNKATTKNSQGNALRLLLDARNNLFHPVIVVN